LISQNSASYLHVVMGTGVVGKIQTAPQCAALGITSTKHHMAHSRLNKGPGTHRAGLQGNYHGVLIKPPGGAAKACLAQGNQFGMAKRVLFFFAPVAAPADRPSQWVEHHCSNRNLPATASSCSQPQQPLHPDGDGCFH